MLFFHKQQELGTLPDVSRAKELYFLNYANYGNMMRNGEYEEYRKCHISETQEREWSREIMEDLISRIQSGKDIWRVVNLANLRIDESEILKSFQRISSGQNAQMALAAIEKAESLIPSPLFDKIKRCWS